MPTTLFNLTAGSIFWEKSETEVSQNEIAFVTIKVVGYTPASQSIEVALSLVPALLPISASGPVGNSIGLTNGELQRRSARYDGDGTIRLDAEYKAYVGSLTNGPGGGTGEQSAPEDKIGKRIQTSEEPLLTHPLPQTQFPTAQVNMLSALISGYIRPSSDVSQEDGGSPVGEFVRQNPTTGSWDSIVTFSTTAYTVTMNGQSVSATPLDYARYIKAGITTWKNTGTVLTWSCARKEACNDAELDSVGSVVEPPIAPTITDKQWFYEGINETHETNSLYQIEREYTLTGKGGALSGIYAGGTGEIIEI